MRYSGYTSVTLDVPLWNFSFSLKNRKGKRRKEEECGKRVQAKIWIDDILSWVKGNIFLSHIDGVNKIH